MTPFGETALWVSLKARASLLSAKRRLPLPSRSGNVNMRISSTRPAASNECTSSVLPCVTRAGPFSCFSFATSLAPSRSSTEPSQVRSAPLRVATYFLTRLNALAMSSYDPAFGKGPVRGEDVVGASAEQEVERLAEQFADVFAEDPVDVCDRSDPAAELEAASGVFFRPARGLHHAIHRNHRADYHFSHGSVS